MSAYVITKAIWDAVQKTAVTNHQVSGLLSDASYVVVDCDAGSEFRTLAAAQAAPTIAITRAPSTAGLEGLVAGMTAAEVMTAWTGRPLATVSDGSDPHYAHVVLIDGVRVTGLTATANLTIATTISATGAQDVPVVTQALSVADEVAGPVIPTDPVSPPDPVVPRASSMTHDGATAFFAASHPTGIYADGSPWVSSGGKAISITRITPASASGVSRTKSGGGTTGSTIVNGAMLDPGKAPSGAMLSGRQAVNDGLAKGAPSQSYDSYVLSNNLGFDAAGNVDPGATSKPVSLVEGTILKAISSQANVHSQARPALDKLVPLTVVAAPPAPNAFRPGHADPSKAAWLHVSDIDMDKLPNLSADGLTIPVFPATLAKLRFVSWQHTYNVLSRNLMPGIDGSPVYGGDRDIYTEALLALCYDGWTASQKRQVATAFVQMAIDITARAEQGGIWQENGGHCVGQKSIVALAAHLTGHQRFVDALGYTTTLFAVGGRTASIWAEDRQVFRVAQADVNRRQKHQYNYPASMIGLAEWSSDATRDDPDAPSNFRERIHTLGVDTSGAAEDLKQSYRHIVAGVNVPGALALRLMGAGGLMGSEWLDYQDRHMTARIASVGALPDGKSNDIAPWVVNAWKKDRPSAGTGGGTDITTDPDPDTPPVVTPPVTERPVIDTSVIDLTIPAIVGSLGQSDMAYTTETGNFYNKVPYPFVPSTVNFTMYQSQKSEDLVGGVVKTILTNSNKTKMNVAMVYVALALDYVTPNKPYVFAEWHESGTSIHSLMEDANIASPGYDATKDRLWSNFAATLKALEDDYPQGIDRFHWYWYAAPSADMPKWKMVYSPALYGQYEDGSRFKLGDVNPDPKENRRVHHCFYDFETTDPNTKGRGVFKRTVAMDYSRKGPWGGDLGKMEGMKEFAADPRFKSLGGRYGFFGPSGHAPVDTKHGTIEAAYMFYMPTMLRAAGLRIEEPNFSTAYTAPDGSYVDITLNAVNGGDLTTRMLDLGGDLIQDRITQEIFGFEISPASGGGRYWIVPIGETTFPSKYRGTVKRLNNRTVRYVPANPISDDDNLTFMKGPTYHRRDGVFLYTDDHYNDRVHWRSLPTEKIAAFCDPASDFGYNGPPVRTTEDGWILKRGQTVNTYGEPSGATLTVPPISKPTALPASDAVFFKMKETGPYFVDPNNVPENTTCIRHRFRLRIPASVAESNKAQFVVTQESNGFDIRLLCRTGSTSIYIHKIEDKGGLDVTPVDKVIWNGSRDEWVNIEVYANQKLQKVGIRVNDGPVEVRAMTGATGGEFQSSREICYFGQTSGASLLSAGVDVAFIETYFTVDGVETLRKRVAGNATTVNADPWRQGEAA